MSTFKKKELTELVGGDVFAGGNDRNVTRNSEIETGPVQKPYNDDSDYEKGVSTTTDRVFGRYRQNIPWFAVYSYGGTRAASGIKTVNETDKKSIVVKKNTVEEKIEDLEKDLNFFYTLPSNKKNLQIKFFFTNLICNAIFHGYCKKILSFSTKYYKK